jgi:hypothetical protein
MSIIHKGIRRKTTDVLDDYGQAHYAQNWRYRLAGEIGRRPGIGKTDMAQQAGPVLLLGFGSYFEPYVVQMVGGTVVATADPLPLWSDPTLVIPVGVAAEPAAPVINFFTCVPPSPQVYAGSVPFVATPDITYDGLSGPLSYQWQSLTRFGLGGSMPILGATTNPTCTYLAPVAAGVGTYGGIALTVTPAGNPAFAASNGFSYELT